MPLIYSAMAKIYKLANQFKNYNWGSVSVIPDFLNFKNDDNLPYAEMWMGTHSGAPSKAVIPAEHHPASEKLENLKGLAGELPFLFKILAIEKPLSLQVHPDKEQAVLGFKAEEKAGLSLNDPARNYKDPNPKHEIICALSEFKIMAGFREKNEILRSFTDIASLSGELAHLLDPMIGALNQNSLGGFFKEHFNFSEAQKEIISSEIFKIDPAGTEKDISNEQWNLMKTFAGLYKNDPAVLSPLYLNILTLQPAQAVFIPAGTLHMQLSGFGLELMNNSDNVLRGGLTKKYIDIQELRKVINVKSFLPEIMQPSFTPPSFCYPIPTKDFLLSGIIGNGSELLFKADSPVIGIVSEGGLSAEGLVLKRGESFFIPKSQDRCVFKGSFTMYTASCGDVTCTSAGCTSTGC